MPPLLTALPSSAVGAACSPAAARPARALQQGQELAPQGLFAAIAACTAAASTAATAPASSHGRHRSAPAVVPGQPAARGLDREDSPRGLALATRAAVPGRLASRG